MLLLFSLKRVEIARAARIVAEMKEFHDSKIGAFGLDDGKGGLEMIDAPMVKQVGWMSFTLKITDRKIGGEHVETSTGSGVVDSWQLELNACEVSRVIKGVCRLITADLVEEVIYKTL